ncbi:MAG: CcoQ/FixQ family Cbb3-type cytochrome c oxidase assembly chaperone [Betaproteobacteria bacterium]|nr:CcoQ/FixQ family Cbb3-type cytochrome c oxidase assembly chaperone [Betaproteobacteria bacterium]
MDIDDLRSLATVLAFATFVGITAWAWSGKRRDRFDAAARLPLEEEEDDGEGAAGRKAR